MLVLMIAFPWGGSAQWGGAVHIGGNIPLALGCVTSKRGWRWVILTPCICVDLQVERFRQVDSFGEKICLLIEICTF